MKVLFALIILSCASYADGPKADPKDGPLKPDPSVHGWGTVPFAQVCLRQVDDRTVNGIKVENATSTWAGGIQLLLLRLDDPNVFKSGFKKSEILTFNTMVGFNPSKERRYFGIEGNYMGNNYGTNLKVTASGEWDPNGKTFSLGVGPRYRLFIPGGMPKPGSPKTKEELENWYETRDFNVGSQAFFGSDISLELMGKYGTIENLKQNYVSVSLPFRISNRTLMYAGSLTIQPEKIFPIAKDHPTDGLELVSGNAVKVKFDCSTFGGLLGFEAVVGWEEREYKQNGVDTQSEDKIVESGIRTDSMKLTTVIPLDLFSGK